MAENASIETVFDDESLYVGQVYAKALLSAAEAEGKVDLIVEQLTSIVRDGLKPHPQLELFFADPKRSVDEKIAIIDKLFGGQVDPILTKSLKVIARRRRLGMLGSIAAATTKMRDEALGRLPVTVTSATEIDPKTLSGLEMRLKELLKADVIVTAKVDPKILGGLVVRVGDTVFDGSIDGQLEQMRKQTRARAEQTMREKLTQLST